MPKGEFIKTLGKTEGGLVWRGQDLVFHDASFGRNCGADSSWVSANVIGSCRGKLCNHLFFKKKHGVVKKDRGLT